MSNNPLIKDLMANEAFPSTSIALPTGGRWYPLEMFGEDVDVNDLEVGVLGVVAEQSFRDPWLMLSGEALPRMLRSICPGVNDPNGLADIDIEAILIASRLVSYGAELKVEHTCEGMVPNPEFGKKVKKGEDPHPEQVKCDTENLVVVDLYDFIQRYEQFTPEFLERFIVPIPRVNQIVHLRPMPYSHTIKMIREGIIREQQMDALDDYEVDALITNPEVVERYTRIAQSMSAGVLDSLTAIIYAIETSDGERVKGDEFIKEWLMAMTADDVKLVTTRNNELNRELRQKAHVDYTCEACGHKNTFRLELDANRLFGQAEDSKAPKKPSRKSPSTERVRKVR